MECSLPEEWEKYSLLVMIIYIYTDQKSVQYDTRYHLKNSIYSKYKYSIVPLLRKQVSGICIVYN